jgi:hypothetical protein
MMMQRVSYLIDQEPLREMSIDGMRMKFTSCKSIHQFSPLRSQIRQQKMKNRENKSRQPLIHHYPRPQSAVAGALASQKFKAAIDSSL